MSTEYVCMYAQFVYMCQPKVSTMLNREKLVASNTVKEKISKPLSCSSSISPSKLIREKHMKYES